MLEFPVSHGLTNFRHRKDASEEDRDSWCVRYYSFRELRELFRPLFAEFDIEADCYFGIGVRPEDWDLLPWTHRAVIACSETLKTAARFAAPVRFLSDSVFVKVAKPVASGRASDRPELTSGDNLAILPMLQCPLTGGSLEYDRENSRLISREAGKAYPIIDNIPIMLPEEAVDC